MEDDHLLPREVEGRTVPSPILSHEEESPFLDAFDGGTLLP